MADVKFQVIRDTLPDIDSSKDFTIAGFGTCKGALLLSTDGLVDGVIVNTARFTYGFTDGANQQSVGFASDGSSTSNTSRSVRDVAMFTQINDFGAATAIYSATVIPDGINLAATGSTSYNALCTVVLIGGADVEEVFVGSQSLGTSTSPVAINAPGFEPSLVIGGTIATQSPAAQGLWSFGVGANDGSDTNKSVQYGSADNQAIAKVNALISNTKGVGRVFNDDTGWQATIAGYNPSGFTVQPSESASGSTFAYIAIKLAAGVDVSVFDMQWPTASPYTETSPGFEPDFGLIVSLVGPTSRDVRADSSNMGVSVAAFDASNLYTVNGIDEDASSSQNNVSLSDERLRILNYTSGTPDSVLASGYSFNSSGWTFPLTVSPAAPVLGFGIAIGPGGGVTPSISFDGPAVTTINGTQNTALPSPTPDPAMNTRFTVSGGTASYSLQSGTLPAGVTIDPTTGNLVGTPTETGTFDGIVVRGTV